MANSQDVAQLLVRVNASTELLKRNLNEAERAVASFQADTDRRLGQIDGRFDRLGKGLDRFKAGFATLGAGLAATVSVGALVVAGEKFLDLADRSKQLGAQLRLATQDFGNFNTAQADVARIADDTRGSLEATGKLYGSFLRASEPLGRSQTEAARATETFAKALKIGGAGAAEASSATLQFGQALASGALRGDEFNSINEASPRIMKLLADSLGVPTGALRKMAEEGQLTSDKLYAALTDRKFTQGIDQEFAQLPVTMDDAMTKIENAAIRVFGAFDDGGQFSTALASFLTRGTTTFDGVEDQARGMGVELRAIFDGLGDVFDPLEGSSIRVFDFIESRIRALQSQIAGLLDKYDQADNLFIDADNYARQGDNAIKGFFNRVIDRSGGGKRFNISPLAPRADRSGTFLRGNEQSQAEANYRLGIGLDRPGSFEGGLGSIVNNALGRTSPRRIVPAPTKPSGTRPRAGGGSRSTGAAALSEYEKLLEHVDILSRNVGEQLKGITYDPTDYGDVRPDLTGFENEREARFGVEEELRTRQEQNIRSLAGLYQDLFEGGTGSIFDTFKRLGLSAVSEILAKFTISKLGGLLDGGGGGILSGLFGGAFAAGGAPPVGKISLVGERGPELFVPKVPGMIVPNGGFGGGTRNTINVSVDARGSSDPQSVQRAVEAGMAQAYAASVGHTNNAFRELARDRL